MLDNKLNEVATMVSVVRYEISLGELDDKSKKVNE